MPERSEQAIYIETLMFSNLFFCKLKLMCWNLWFIMTLFIPSDH